MKPLVTIGMPFFNPGKHIVNAIQSVFAQSYSNWELLLIDDGSTDGALELVRSVKDERVRVISDGQNRGLAARLNQIANMARGDYIARMDADDIMHSARISRQVDILESSSNYVAVTSGCYYMNLVGKIIGVRRGRAPTLRDVFLRGGYLHASLLARREWLMRCKYNEKLRRAEDREFFIRTELEGAKICVLPELLYFYRWGGNVRLEAWLASYREERDILSSYGPRAFGVARTKFWIFRSHAKSVVLRGLGVIGKEQMLARLAVEAATDVEYQSGVKELSNICSRFLPG